MLERKVGEFGDGVRDGYLDRDQVIDRNDFARVACAVNGQIAAAKKKRLMKIVDFKSLVDVDEVTFDKYRIGIIMLQFLRSRGKHQLSKISQEELVRMIAGIHLVQQKSSSSNEAIAHVAQVIKKSWKNFVGHVKSINNGFQIKSKKGAIVVEWSGYASSPQFLRDVDEFYSQRLEKTEIQAN